MKLPRFEKLSSALLVALCMVLVGAEAVASGYYLPGRGVKPLGRAGAFVASGGGDLNSLWYNPANLRFDESYELTIDAGGIGLGHEFHRAPRTEDDRTITYEPVSDTSPPDVSPQILVGGPTFLEDLSWSAGFYAPYMTGQRFPEDGPQRYSLVDNSGSALAFFHGALSYEFSDHLRVGAGVQNAIGSFRLVSVVSGYTGPYGRPEDRDLDILSKLEFDDYFAPAANAGVWVALSSNVEAAISAQSPVAMRDGDAKIDVRMGSHPSFDGARLTNDTVDVGLTLPPIVRAALRVVVDPVDVELAGVWEGWSVFDEFEVTPNDIEVENVRGVDSLPVGPLTVPKNYNDTFSVRLGGDYRIDETWTARAGYAFETGAAPDERHSVFVADSDKHVFSSGLSWHHERWRLDAGAAYYHLFDRDVTDSQVRQINPTDTDDELATIVGNGHYSARYFVLGVGGTYRFE